jgi:hypothetical protein
MAAVAPSPIPDARIQNATLFVGCEDQRHRLGVYWLDHRIRFRRQKP